MLGRLRLRAQCAQGGHHRARHAAARQLLRLVARSHSTTCIATHMPSMTAHGMCPCTGMHAANRLRHATNCPSLVYEQDQTRPPAVQWEAEAGHKCNIDYRVVESFRAKTQQGIGRARKKARLRARLQRISRVASSSCVFAGDAHGPAHQVRQHGAQHGRGRLDEVYQDLACVHCACSSPAASAACAICATAPGWAALDFAAGSAGYQGTPNGPYLALRRGHKRSR